MTAGRAFSIATHLARVAAVNACDPCVVTALGAKEERALHKWRKWEKDGTRLERQSVTHREYDIREINEELYLLVLEGAKAVREGHLPD